MTDVDDRGQGRLSLTALAALGVVYGDIGTSPLYAFKLSFANDNSIAATQGDILGVLSLIVWALIIVVSIKYLMFVLKADNNGEGGIIALVALLNPWAAAAGTTRHTLMILGLFGAALLFGDGTITPAISVLSAVEGLQVDNPNLDTFVIPITIAILVALFAIQSRGTAKIGALFGPVMLIWFLILGGLGLGGILKEPHVLAALSPIYGLSFVVQNGLTGVIVLGNVFLAVTGAEALYADLGHFGRRPIRAAWFFVALPALLLNYFGQGGLVLAHPGSIAHPFYELSPGWFHYPLVAVATLATIIASQAVISGVFSLTRQAMQLGQLPRVKVMHTDIGNIGQIYIPSVNWLLMVASVALVLGFRSSANLGAAYGLAVAADMVITTFLAFFVARRFGWNPVLVGLLALAFLVVDVTFLLANAFKFLEGGWYPVLVAFVIFMTMSIWRLGLADLKTKTSENRQPLSDWLVDIRRERPKTVPGTAVFLTAFPELSPVALRLIMTHMPVIHERTLFVTIRIQDVPRVAAAGRIELDELDPGIWRVIVSYGFMQTPDIPLALKLCRVVGLEIDPDDLTYFTGLEEILSERTGSWARQLRIAMFTQLWRNAQRMSDTYDLPPDRTVVIGQQIRL